jgi:hypothetical protein
LDDDNTQKDRAGSQSNAFSGCLQAVVKVWQPHQTYASEKDKEHTDSDRDIA